MNTDYISQEIEKSKDLKLAVVELINTKKRKYNGDKVFTFFDGIIQPRGKNIIKFTMIDKDDKKE